MKRWTLWFFTALLLAAATAAEAGKPSLGLIKPPGAQRGTEQSITLTGQRIGEPEDILWYKPGIEVLELVSGNKKGTAVQARLRVAAEAGLGTYPFRLRTRDGLSDLKTFRVGPFPQVDEQEPNSDFSEPQVIPLNVTVNGVIQNEDVDFFAVEVQQGQRLNVEIEGIRIGQMLFDPFIAILDEKRFELAASDDTALLLQDAAAGLLAPADGRLIIEVRETSYGGSDQALYRLHVGTFPRPVAVYPPGGPPGQEITVRYIGDAGGAIEQLLQLPDQPGTIDVFPAVEGPPAPSGIPFRVSTLPNTLETEPNNTRQQATPSAGELPAAFHGILQKPEDHDWFRFSANKGQNLAIRVFARDVRSPVDSVIDVFDAKGKRLGGNDDSGGPDSRLAWKAPEDGEYFLRVRDHLNDGGDDYVYRVELQPQEPSVVLNLPEFRRNKQDRMAAEVPQGNREALLLRATRERTGGPVAVKLEGLPEGVTATVPDMPPGMDTLPVLFEAAAEAPRQAVLLKAAARSNDEKKPAEGTLRQTIALVRANPNNTVYAGCEVEGLPLAVTEPLPFRLAIEQPKVPLVNGGSLALKITAERDEGFETPIKVRMLYTPPGVSAPPEITINKGESTAFISLNADGKAEARTWPLTVIGSSAVKGGERWAASPFTDLEVSTPFMSGNIDLFAVEQGQPVEVVCALESLKPFEGEAEIRLLGLPAKTTAEPVRVTPETKEAVFTVTTQPDSPVGKHNSLFCSLDVPLNGGTVRHSIGGLGTLRIDAPPKEPAQPPPAKIAKQEEPKKAAPKRLSRLEQLRRQAQERSSGG